MHAWYMYVTAVSDYRHLGRHASPLCLSELSGRPRRLRIRDKSVPLALTTHSCHCVDWKCCPDNCSPNGKDVRRRSQQTRTERCGAHSLHSSDMAWLQWRSMQCTNSQPCECSLYSLSASGCTHLANGVYKPLMKVYSNNYFMTN